MLPRVLFVALLAASASAAAHDDEVRPAVCLHPKEFVLGGVKMSIYRPAVEKVLGKKYQLKTSTSEDDGGRYAVTHLIYPTLMVNLGAGNRGVERISTKSPRVVFGPGVRVGMPLSRVGELLRFRGDFSGGQAVTVRINACGFDDRPVLRLSFRASGDQYNSDSMLDEIEVTFYGP